MLVRHHMTPNPVTVGPQEMLVAAQKKMVAGRFRRVPVLQEGTLIGILTDRDIRRHVGTEERTKISAAMTETPLTVSPLTTIEDATQLMLKHQISGLPVLENGKLIGIITTSDILKAFLEMTGALVENSFRVNVLAKDGGSLADATRLVNEAGGEVLGIGTYGDPAEDQRVFFLRVRGIESGVASTALRNKGYTVLNIH